MKLARLYEPFGQVLAQTGTGEPIYGYLGAQFDRISGLLYINGRYYDPVTGRFLSPNSGGSSPYVPLGGAALAPILILALIGRRKKGKIWTGWVIIALMMSASLTVVGCNMPDPQPDDNNNPTPTTETNPDPTGTATPVPTPSATPVPPTATPLPPPTATCPSTSTSTPALGNLHRRWFIAKDHNKPDNPKVQNEPDNGWTCSPIALFILLRNVGAESDPNKVIKAVDDIPPSQGGLSHHYKERKCKLDNPVCTSLKVIEKVAREDYAGPHCLTVDAREGWTKEEIMGYIARDIPVMVNYGGGVEGLVGHSIVAYGYDLDVGTEGTFWFLDPMTNSIKPWPWKDFNPLWNASDYGDHLKENTDGTYNTYYNWAMAIYK